MTQIFKENTKKYKIKTDKGYRDFRGIAYMGDRPIYRVNFSNNRFLECTDNHVVFLKNKKEIEVRNLKIGDAIKAFPKNLKVTEIIDTGRIEPVYDIIGVDGVERYYTNGILSHNCRFITKDETLINGMLLENMFGVEPKFKEGEIRYYEPLKANFTYIVTLDPSSGVGRDASAIQVLQLPDLRQVAEWRSENTDIKGQVSVLLKILHKIHRELKINPHQISDPQIYWTFENNGGYGDAVMMVVNDTGEDLFPGEFIHEPKRAGSMGKRFGLNTSERKKLTACMRLKSLIESDRIKLFSMALIRELKSFVAKGDSFAAKSGAHDDLISAVLLAIRIMDIVQQWDEDFGQKLKEIVDSEEYDVEPLPISFM